MEENRVWGCSVNFGCDPELFFATRDGKIVGSEKVIPTAGLFFKGKLRYDDGYGKYVQDGVQVEINPQAKSCRGNLANEIGVAFRTLRAHLATLPNMTVSFKSVVEVDKAELATLSDKAKLLGCQPSLNIHDKAATVSVNPATYLTRSAGGHIHLGLQPHLLPHAARLVPIMDYIIGNTCVLIDRDPMAAERRKVYGRAGEYRLPMHGVEYRTLSNFWLKSYQLMSMVMGLARLSNAILHTTEMTENYWNGQWDRAMKWDAESALLKCADVELVRRAINENNVELAKKNFEGIREFIGEYVRPMESCLDMYNLVAFDHFVKMIDKKGLDYWFPEDPMEHWCKVGVNAEIQDRFGHIISRETGQTDAHGQGAEAFLYGIQAKLMQEAAQEEGTNVPV